MWHKKAKSKKKAASARKCHLPLCKIPRGRKQSGMNRGKWMVAEGEERKETERQAN